MTTTYDTATYLEEVYAALLALLTNATFAAGVTLKRIQRATVVPDTVPVVDQPALILIEGPLHAEQKDAFALAKWTFTALAVIYVRADGAATGQNPLPITTANYIIWGIKNAFNTAPPYGKQTLGGLVHHAWIEGEVLPEVSSEQMIITVPIYMLAGPV